MTEQPELVELPARSVLAVDGVGPPEAPAFAAAVRALFAARAALGDRADVPLEGTYTQDGDPSRFDLGAPEGWHWTLAVPAPAGAAAAGVRFGVQLRRCDGGRAAAVLHRGPYDDEQPSLDALYAFVRESDLVPAGPHTEVYLTDPNTTAEADLRTLLRVPVQ